MKRLIVISVYISIIFSQNNEKIILKSEIQEYLFSIQDILHDFMKLEGKILNQKENSTTSKFLESTGKMLLKRKADFHRFQKRKYNKKEKKLIAQIDNYAIELEKAITQLKLISVKNDKSHLQSLTRQSEDNNKLIRLKKSFKNERQRLNVFLNDFILTNIPAMTH